MEPRVARLHLVAPPADAAPVARFGGQDDADGPGGAPPAEPGGAGGARVTAAGLAGRPDSGLPEESDDSWSTDAGPAPVAELGAAHGLRAAGAPTARLDGAGGRRRAPLLIVPPQPEPEAGENPPDDQHRAGTRRARTGARRGAAAARKDALRADAQRVAAEMIAATRGEAAPREPAPRRGGPKQIDPDADPVAAAREICLRLLTDRARTRHELAQALRQRGVPDEAAGSVLERFDEVGLIDDAAFAGQYVRSRHNHRGLARRAIAMELRRKGVDGEVAEEALGEVDADAEERRARELVDRKLRTVPADTPEQRKKVANRLVGMLARKGYGGGVAYRVVREALADHGAEIDELLDD